MMAVCVGCGKILDPKIDNKTSLKHPYCNDCFENKFDNNLEKYNKFLEYTHK